MNEKTLIDDLPEHFSLASIEADKAHPESEVISRQSNRNITIEHRILKNTEQPCLVTIEYILDESNKVVYVNFKQIYHQLKLDYNVNE